MRYKNHFFFKALFVIFLESFAMKVLPCNYKIDSYLYIYFIVLNLNQDFIENIIKILILGIFYDIIHSDICNHSFAVVNSLAYVYFILLKNGKKSFIEDLINNYDLIKSNMAEKYFFLFKICLVYHGSLIFVKIMDSGVAFIDIKKEFFLFLLNILLMIAISTSISSWRKLNRFS